MDERRSLRAQVFDQTGNHCFSSLSTLQREESACANTFLTLDFPITQNLHRGQLKNILETTSKFIDAGSNSRFELLKHGQHMLLVILVHTVSYVQISHGLRSSRTDPHKTRCQMLQICLEFLI